MGRGLKAAGTAKSGRCKPGGGDTGDMGAAVDIMAGWSVWESLRLSRAAVSWLETRRRSDNPCAPPDPFAPAPSPPHRSQISGLMVTTKDAHRRRVNSSRPPSMKSCVATRIEPPPYRISAPPLRPDPPAVAERRFGRFEAHTKAVAPILSRSARGALKYSAPGATFGENRCFPTTRRAKPCSRRESPPRPQPGRDLKPVGLADPPLRCLAAPLQSATARRRALMRASRHAPPSLVQ